MEEPVYRVDEWGNKFWYVNNRLHRTDGPALVLADGTQVWYVNDQLHRTSGPAIIWANGTQEWFIDDKDITKEVAKWMNERNISWPFSDEETSTELKNRLTDLSKPCKMALLARAIQPG